MDFTTTLLQVDGLRLGVQNIARSFTVIRTLGRAAQSIIVCCGAYVPTFIPTRADDERLPRSL